MSYYAAGEIVRQEPQNLYSLSVQKQYQTAVRGRQFLPWVHPPVEALLFAPLTLLGIDQAFRVWEALSIVGLCWIAFSMRRLLGDLTGVQLGAVFAAGWLPLGCGLAAGQDHIVCLLLYTWVFLLADEGRDGAAGCCLGLTFVRFQLAIPVLLFFVVMRRWRVVGGAAATVAAMAAVSFAVVGRALVPSYRAAIVYLAAVHDVPSLTRMPSMRGLLAFVVKEPRELVMATAVASVAVLVVGALTWMRADKRRFDLVFASALLLALAVDYHVFMYDLSVVVLAGVLIVRRWPRFTVWLWVMGVAEAASGAGEPEVWAGGAAAARRGILGGAQGVDDRSPGRRVPTGADSLTGCGPDYWTVRVKARVVLATMELVVVSLPMTVMV